MRSSSEEVSRRRFFKSLGGMMVFNTGGLAKSQSLNSLKKIAISRFLMYA